MGIEYRVKKSLAPWYHTMDKNTKTALVVAVVAFFLSRDLRTTGILGATAFAANYFL